VLGRTGFGISSGAGDAGRRALPVIIGGSVRGTSNT